MSNKSISDYLASSMDSVLKSPEHKSLFGQDYKVATASDESCDKEHDHDEDTSLADSSTVEDEEDENSADDEEALKEVAAQYTTAIDSLLVASAALDNIGYGNGAALSLKLAALTVEAKKKDTEGFKEKMQALRDKKKKDKEVNDAKDKASKDKEKAAKEKEKEKEKAAKEKEKLAKEKEKEKEKLAKQKAAEKAAAEKAAKDKASKK